MASGPSAIAEQVSYRKVRLFFLCILLAGGGAAYGQDYQLDPDPRYYLGPADSEGQPYAAAQDPQACRLYLANLSYFAKRKLPMSCGQPVAPDLITKIRPVQWEDLDPRQYSGLFKAVVKAVFPPGRSDGSDYPSDTMLSDWRAAVRSHAAVFRRAKLNLAGHVLLPSTVAPSTKIISMQVVQFGFNVTDPSNPDPATRCVPRALRAIPADNAMDQDIFLVSPDLRELYGQMSDMQVGEKPYFDLLTINGRLYGELYDDKGDVLLSDVRFDPFVHFERICLFHYKHRVK